MKGKKPEIAELCNSTQPDIMVITETKIDSTVSSSEFLPPNYVGHIRKDRTLYGGGVMIAVRSGLVVDEVTVEHLNSEIVCARFSMTKSNPLYVMAYYRPPDDQESCDGLQAALEDLQNISSSNPRSCIIAAGDFNAKDVQWDTLSTKDNADQKSICERIISIITENHLHQLQRQPTRKKAILDLFCINNPSLVKSMQTVPGISDHDGIILADISLRAQINKKPQRSVPIWAKANWESLKNKSQEFCIDFMSSFQTRNVQQNWDIFSNHMQEMLKSIPSKSTSTRYNLPWLTPDIRRMCRKKRRLYKTARGSKEKWVKFQKHQEATRKALRDAHWKYVNSILKDDLESGRNKSFWSYIKSQKQDSIGVAPLRKGSQLYSDSTSKSKLLSDQFKSVFTIDTPDTKDTRLHGPHYPPIDDLFIDEKGVQKLLEDLNPSKASGPDQIPAKLLKILAPELTPAITKLFRQSVLSGTLPGSWKQAWISPVYKKGNRNEPANYRPVSLTCILCKTLEHIFCTHIRRHLDRHGILTPDNHGFRAKHSCESQLLLTTHDILRHRDSGKQVDIAILDFSKAFDTVPHHRLLGKLAFYGINGPVLKWIEDFLIGRSQSVLVDGVKSDNERVLSGVPQGTVLGPLLFLLHINEMPSVVDPKTQCRLFADDCLLYRVVDNAADQFQLQKDLKALESWSALWGMQFNASKCHVMLVNKGRSYIPFQYQLCETILGSVSHEKYLGVELSKDMSWSPHIRNITAKAHQKLGFLRRNLRGSPIECKRLAYIAIVRSGLEYASSIWDPHLLKDINALEKVQRKASRWATSVYEPRASVSSLLKDLQLDSLESRRKQQRLIFMYKILNEHVAVPADSLGLVRSSRLSRGHLNQTKLFRPRTYTTEFSNSFVNKTIPEWNALPNTVAQADTVANFKCRLSMLP